MEKFFFPIITDSYKCCRKLPLENANVLIFNEFVKSLNGIGSCLTDNHGNIIYQPIVMKPQKEWGSICDFVNNFTLNCQPYIVQANFRRAMSFIALQASK